MVKTLPTPFGKAISWTATTAVQSDPRGKHGPHLPPPTCTSEPDVHPGFVRIPLEGVAPVRRDLADHPAAISTSVGPPLV